MPKEYKDIPYETLEDEDVSDEVYALIEKKTQAAEDDLKESRVNFRWGQQQLTLVKRVAHIMGVPYQTYIKQTLFRQALRDLQEMNQVLENKS